MSKLHPMYVKGDVKYFYNLHRQRMHQMGEQPLTYSAFYSRLKRGSTLKESIYTPLKRMPRYNMKPKKNKIWIRFISFIKKCQSKSEIQKN